MLKFRKGLALFLLVIAYCSASPLSTDDNLVRDTDGNSSTLDRNLRSNWEDQTPPDDYATISIGSYCRMGKSQAIALGPCSSTFILCATNGHYAFQQCPLEQVFDGKDYKCSECCYREAGRSRSSLHHGPGVQFTTDRCSRQALVCDSSREPHSVSCTGNEIIDPETLRCIPAPSSCQWVNNPIQDHFLRDYCRYQPLVSTPSYQPFDDEQSLRCQNWYVDCHDFQFVFCDAGQIYDKDHGCRPPLPQERCPVADLCRGYEWQAVSQGDCNPQFRYCEGFQTRIFTCREGHVFQDKACVPSKRARGCPECTYGDTKPAQHCRQYFECQPFEDTSKLWALQTCPDNEFYNRETRRCEFIRGSACADYQQACRDGDSYNPTCGDYLLCREGQFHPGKCPHLTSWSKSHRQCIPDNSCRRYDNQDRCRPNDIIPTSDCKYYYICDASKGEFVKRSCKESLYENNPACDQCNIDKPQTPTWDNYTPVKCNHGEKIVDKTDCSRYIACVHGKWLTLQCEDDAVFDPATGACVHESKSRCPRDHSFNSLHLPPQPEDFGAESGWGSAFPPAPPPTFDGSRREMYQEFNGHFVCLDDSPRFVADPQDCASYLECINNLYQPRVCPVGQNFDAFKGRCSRSFRCTKACIDGERKPRKECGKVFECINNSWQPKKCKNGGMFVDGKCSDIPCNRDQSPSACFEGAVYANEQDCTRFVVCRNGQLVQRQCSNGQKFDPDRLACSYNYECQGDSAPDCYTGEIRVIDKDVGSACNSQYEECQYGRFVKVSCPYGKSFDPISKKCKPGPCKAEYGFTEVCTESPGLDGFRADPIDCTRFYQCANGRWVPKNCAPGTAFAPHLGVCDHIRNVPNCARA